MSNSKQKQQNKTEARNKVTVSFTDEGWEDFTYWSSNNTDIFNRLQSLINDCLRTPFKGIGKPEPLKGDLTGFWSRRINHEHRLVYFYESGVLTILQCRYHYDE